MAVRTISFEQYSRTINEEAKKVSNFLIEMYSQKTEKRDLSGGVNNNNNNNNTNNSTLDYKNTTSAVDYKNNNNNNNNSLGQKNNSNDNNSLSKSQELKKGSEAEVEEEETDAESLVPPESLISKYEDYKNDLKKDCKPSPENFKSFLTSEKFCKS